MTYLIASDWVIDYLKGRLDATALLKGLRPHGIAISAATFGEVYQGVFYGTDRKNDETVLRRFLVGVRILPIDRYVARRFAITRGFLHSSGLGIDDLDTLIAATALYHDLTLVTRNLRHFQRIPGLKLYHVS